MAERQCYSNVLTFLAMATMECVNIGLFTLYKAATLRGMNYRIFMVYSNAIATLVLLPAPFVSLRSRVLPPLSFSILCKIGLLGLIGGSSQMLGYIGINFSSPTLSSAIGNLTPALTFILAILFRMDRVSFKKSSSQAKVLGTLVSINGNILHLGSVIGAAIITIGVHTVIWANAKGELADDCGDCGPKTLLSAEKTPLFCDGKFWQV